MNKPTEDLPSADPAVESPAPVDGRRRKRNILLCVLAYSFVVGLIGSGQEDDSLDLLLGIPFLVMGILWCHADARQRGRSLGRPMKILLILAFIVGLPVYLFQTRGLGAFKSLALVAVVVAAVLGLEVAGVIAGTMLWGEV